MRRRAPADADENSWVGRQAQENSGQIAGRHPRVDFGAARRLESRTATSKLQACGLEGRLIPLIETNGAPRWNHAQKGDGDAENACERGPFVGDGRVIPRLTVHNQDRSRRPVRGPPADYEHRAMDLAHERLWEHPHQVTADTTPGAAPDHDKGSVDHFRYPGDDGCGVAFGHVPAADPQPVRGEIV